MGSHFGFFWVLFGFIGFLLEIFEEIFLKVILGLLKFVLADVSEADEIPMQTLKK